MKKLSILGLKVTIKIKNPNDPEADAEWHPDVNQIWLRPNAPEPFVLILHELTHAIFVRSGVYQARIHDHIEEVLCEAVANVINENMITLWQMHNKLTKKPKRNNIK